MNAESAYSWIPSEILEKLGVRREGKDIAFATASGRKIRRSVGFAIIKMEKSCTIDEVIFAEPGDPTVVGARTLAGLSLKIDPRKKKLIASGPIVAA